MSGNYDFNKHLVEQRIEARCLEAEAYRLGKANTQNSTRRRLLQISLAFVAALAALLSLVLRVNGKPQITAVAFSDDGGVPAVSPRGGVFGGVRTGGRMNWINHSG